MFTKLKEAWSSWTTKKKIIVVLIVLIVMVVFSSKKEDKPISTPPAPVAKEQAEQYLICDGGYYFGNAPYEKDDQSVKLVLGANSVQTLENKIFQPIMMQSCEAGNVINFGDKDCDANNLSQNQVGSFDKNTKKLVIKNITYVANATAPIKGEYVCR